MTRLLVRCLIVICIVVTTSPVWAQRRNAGAVSEKYVSAVSEAIAKEIDRQQLVGVAVGIIKDAKVVMTKGYGLADNESKQPVTPKTVFNWASNSKPLAAVAAIQLVEQGKLDFDVDIRTYMPEFPAKDAVITTRHL